MSAIKNTISGIIISAGFSSRMGKFKPLMIYNDLPFIINILLKMNPVCREIIVVTGYQSIRMKTEIENYLLHPEILPAGIVNKKIIEQNKSLFEKVKIIFNTNYKKGMFTSLQKGLGEASHDWILYHFCDQPDIPSEYYSEFTKQIDVEYNWIQPAYSGKKGHPILFNSEVSKMIKDSSADSNLKIISENKNIRKKIWNCTYPQVLNDIDTVEDYKKLGKH
ncbi:MAG: NTP transferase domain-containing protein [Melioribacteraceae bacterium]|nr:NTP transferase domain-containing protein [Melioribacteraceae bacterium]MCF8353404.1 NTP transferase domain-containing protein [Melioribacteraceae bacterium]MCF8393017.1 NTP transferase domain-containing protein [Melioribacteraceae bacterium]MCF8419130.1 NTP transferase domain-containing protein [Melioribacteraceae bacterium]